MERIVARNIRAFPQEHGRLSPLQHGLRPRHSCLTQLLEKLHHWAATLDEGKSTNVVFLDFAKAFDSVPHQRLLMKLEHVGIRGQVLKWVEAFLTGRQQRVVVNGHSFSWASVTSGAPQGSVLGPLLFIIFIDDIMDEVSSPGGLFADDCVLYREVSCKNDAEELQRDLEKILEWTRTWQLSLNAKKCKVLEITNRRTTVKFEYSINGSKLESVDSLKYLGVLIDKKLRWNTHCKSIATKAMRMLNVLKRSMSGCSQKSKAIAYRTLVRPHLEYCAQAWNPHTARNIEMLEKVQKRAARWITAKWDKNTKRWSKAYHESFIELKWQSLQQRRNYLTCCQVYKIQYNMDCIDFDSYFTFSRAPQTRFCNASTLQCISSRVNAFRYSFFGTHLLYGMSFHLKLVVHVRIILLSLNCYNTFLLLIRLYVQVS